MTFERLKYVVQNIVFDIQIVTKFLLFISYIKIKFLNSCLDQFIFLFKTLKIALI